MLPETNDAPRNGVLPSEHILSRETQSIISTPLNASNSESAHQKVVTRIQELEHEILILKTYNNAGTITCRLPAEILSNVFIFMKASAEESPTPQEHYSWTKATQVCRQWRSTAVDCVALWTHLDLSWPAALLRLFLERSKNAPLSIVCMLRSPTLCDQEFIAMALSDPGRIRSLVASEDSMTTRIELRVLNVRPPPLKTFLSSWTGCAPVLERLDLQWTLHSGNPLPQNFLEGGAPNLSHLTVAGFDFQWSSLPLFPSIRVLEVTNYQVHMNPEVAQAEFYNSLRQIPFLHTLKLWSCPPETEQPLPRSDASRLVFNSLKSIAILDEMSYVNAFLQVARAPTATSITVEYTDVDEPASSHNQFVDNIRRSLDSILTFWCKQHARLPLRKLRFGALEIGMDLNTSLNSAPASPADCRDNTLHLSLAFQLDSIAKDTPRILGERFDFQTLTSLEFDLDEDDMILWDSDAWGFFSALPNLEAISFCEIESRTIRRVLNEASRFSGFNDDRTPFPSLLRIHLKSITFGFEGNDYTAVERCIEFLATLLRIRSDAGYPISELRIEKSPTIQDHHIARLGTARPPLNVVWDYRNMVGCMLEDRPLLPLILSCQCPNPPSNSHPLISAPQNRLWIPLPLVLV
ncbi:hypothetical protein NMY22_g1502 [Coprinellus aureogranulatus]|nr:hypothetical protein NMY22_g1502 [Coprinellus aureogranulatus]